MADMLKMNNLPKLGMGHSRLPKGQCTKCGKFDLLYGDDLQSKNQFKLCEEHYEEFIFEPSKVEAMIEHRRNNEWEDDNF